MAGMTFRRQNWMQRHSLSRILSAVVAIAGLWQIASPYVLGFAAEQPAMRNAIISGALLTIFALLGFFGVDHWSSNIVSTFNGLAALTGLWLAVSPWILGYQAVVPAFWTALIVGLLSFICAGFAASYQRSGTAPSA